MSEAIAIDMQAHGDMVRALAVRSALKFEATTGMKMTRQSALVVAQRMGLTVKRTKHGAWQDVDAWIRSVGGPAGPESIKLTNGRVIKARKI